MPSLRKERWTVGEPGHQVWLLATGHCSLLLSTQRGFFLRAARPAPFTRETTHNYTQGKSTLSFTTLLSSFARLKEWQEQTEWLLPALPKKPCISLQPIIILLGHHRALSLNCLAERYEKTQNIIHYFNNSWLISHPLTTLGVQQLHKLPLKGTFLIRFLCKMNLNRGI